ncbi:MAG TPA: response regulator transcription factor [Candidatus Scybalocola faecavium]|nr:response regulator transcription factor [Candidatus Scybalocola faecavium]
MIRLAVVDDNSKDRDRICKIVKETARKENFELKVTAMGDPSFLKTDIEEGVYYDIFLLDVEMPGYTGMELARLIQENCGASYIIFVTSHIEYCPEGYEVGALRYILKEKLEEKLPGDLVYVLSIIKKQKDRYFVIHNASGTRKIPYEDIIKIAKEDNKYSLIYTREGEYKVRSSIRSLTEQLKSRAFVVINKGILVNVGHIHDIDTNRILHLSCGLEAEASKSHLTDVRQKVMDYCFGRLSGGEEE